MYRTLLLLPLLLFTIGTNAQINGYAQVTAITDSICTIGAYSEGGTPKFTIGKHVIIMQMQDDAIGENVFNDPTFGSIGSLQHAGAYTVRKILDVERSGTTLLSVTLDKTPGISFNIGPNSSVQLITYEQLGGGGDFTTTSNLGAMSWNGTLGGVLAFYVDGTLNLQHNITVDNAGFRGGTRTITGEGACNNGAYFYDSTGPAENLYAAKGEGIYKRSNTAFARGRGHLLNGGGGGNSNNGGGGGGSNFSTGGDGGAGFGCSGNPSGGIGGVALGTYANGQRVFLGGGGGGGEGDGNSSSVGMRGGGIIIIKADMIRTTGTCGGQTISANGGNANISGTDGAGGGGAGGTILLHVITYDISAGCPLTIRANGGNGGNVNNVVDHGGGGGGGQGTLLFLGMVPITNVTPQTNNGIGGCNNSSTPCSSQAGSGGGSDGAGILYYDASPLPIQLLAFDAINQTEGVDLFWSTATENENEFFLIERSSDGQNWQAIHRLPGAGTSTIRLDYKTRDEAPLPGFSYYRLGQSGPSGETTYSHIVSVDRPQSEGNSMQLIPNPAATDLRIMFDPSSEIRELRFYNELGQLSRSPSSVNSTMVEMDIATLPPGMYMVVAIGDRRTDVQRLVVHP